MDDGVSPLSQADLADGVPASALWGLSELHQILLPQEEASSGDLPSAPLWPGRDWHWQWQHCPQHSHLWVSWESPAPWTAPQPVPGILCPAPAGMGIPRELPEQLPAPQGGQEGWREGAGWQWVTDSGTEDQEWFYMDSFSVQCISSENRKSVISWGKKEQD